MASSTTAILAAATTTIMSSPMPTTFSTATYTTPSTMTSTTSTASATATKMSKENIAILVCILNPISLFIVIPGLSLVVFSLIGLACHSAYKGVCAMCRGVSSCAKGLGRLCMRAVMGKKRYQRRQAAAQLPTFRPLGPSYGTNAYKYAVAFGANDPTPPPPAYTNKSRPEVVMGPDDPDTLQSIRIEPDLPNAEDPDKMKSATKYVNGDNWPKPLPHAKKGDRH